MGLEEEGKFGVLGLQGLSPSGMTAHALVFFHHEHLERKKLPHDSFLGEKKGVGNDLRVGFHPSVFWGGSQGARPGFRLAVVQDFACAAWVDTGKFTEARCPPIHLIFQPEADSLTGRERLIHLWALVAWVLNWQIVALAVHVTGP